jgi:hypothetical protein
MSDLIPKGQVQRNVINRSTDIRSSRKTMNWKIKTQVTEVFPKTIINVVKSPDLPMDYSMNPYQGCEHGCSYCFARPTHEFWATAQALILKEN